MGEKEMKVTINGITYEGTIDEIITLTKRLQEQEECNEAEQKKDCPDNDKLNEWPYITPSPQPSRTNPYPWPCPWPFTDPYPPVRTYPSTDPWDWQRNWDGSPRVTCLYSMDI